MEKQPQNHFIAEFKQKLKVVKNKEHLINNEILQIDSFTTSTHQKTKFIKFGRKTNSVFNLTHLGFAERFNQVFTEYLINEYCEFSERELLLPQLKDIHEEAKQFAEYYLWLKELKVPKHKDKFTDLNIDQRVHALYYLFPSLKNYTKRQLAITLGQILNVGSENIRKNLSDISKIQTKENFYTLIDLFENKTFESITNRIEKESEYFK